MKFATVTMIAIMFGTFSAQASGEFPIARLEGTYSYQGNFTVADIRRQELVPLLTTEGKAKIRDLRKDGYTCINKNPSTSRCWKHWTPTVAPDGIKEALEKFMKGREIEFIPSSREPALTYDGSSQQWTVYDQVRMNRTMVKLYRVDRSYAGVISLAFPVSSEQPLGTLSYLSPEKLGLRLVSNLKESPSVVWTYTIWPYFEVKP